MENMVKLQMRKVPYVDKDNEEKIAYNFFLLCGNVQIPIEVKFFENKEGRDPQYIPRKVVLESYAEVLPPKETSAKPQSKKPSESK